MTDPAIHHAAELLVAARRTGRRLDGLPEAARPRDLAAGFAIQDAVMTLLGERAGGWKVAVPPDGPPTCAPLFASLIHASPCAMPAAAVPLLGVEAEIALRIGKDLPPRATPYTRPEVEAAIDGACAAIEIVDSRYRHFLKMSAEDKLADNVGNGAFTYGAPDYPLTDVPLQAIVDKVAAGAYPAKPARVFRFEDIVEAHRLIENNQAGGKVVVRL